MKRDRFFVILLGMSAVLGFAIHAMWSAARADLPVSTASQIYQPDFASWAFVNLTASYRDYSNESHFVTVARTSVNGRVRFKIVGRYTKTPLGQAWYDRIGSKIRAATESDCKRWTAEGFPIGLNDIEIDIQAQATDKPK